MTESGFDHIAPPSTNEEIYRAIGAVAADAGLSPALVLRSLRDDAQSTAQPRRGLANFLRFLQTGFSTAWLRDFQEHRLLQQILLELCAQSQFLADILVRNPELFRWLTSSNELRATKTSDHYRAGVADATGLFQRPEKKLDSLKRFQRRELLRIGARQILKEADVATTSGELSALADSIIQGVLDLAYAHVSESTQVKPQRDLVVLALGKLGGGELNFSSDIDLMFVYEKDGPLDGSASRITTLHEYHVRVAEFVVRRLSEHTGEGHLYRVDMRLRPDGSSGPLAMSRAAYFAYYEARGESWERQMLIKARVVAGNEYVGEQWMADLQPFVYPKTLLISPLEEIARIKAKIESKIGEATDIKLGSGGIRDIEFTSQALQLLNGGANADIRQRGTVQAIRALTVSGHLSEREGRGLESAYYFLRTIEDRLQLLHGLQEHSLPESAEERTILARQLGYGSATAFSRVLNKHQSKIRQVYQSVFGEEKRREQRGGGTLIESLLNPQRLRKWGFLDPSIARNRIHELTDLLPELGRAERFRSFMGVVRKQRAPDSCIGNFHNLASSGPLRRSLLQAIPNDRAFELIILLCSRTSRYTSMLAREPLLFETMVGRPEDLLSPDIGWEFLRRADLRRFQEYNECKAVVRFIVGETTAPELTRELSRLAEGIVTETFGIAVDDVSGASSVPLALLALGKLGGAEMSIGSDLDVVLLYKEGSKSDVSRTAVAVGRRLRELLEGVYEIDFRLRPEGKNSPLATEFDYYMHYLAHRASLWERQSLVKARVIAGDEAFAAEVASDVTRFTYNSPLPENWHKEIAAMRQRMIRERSKTDKGSDLKVGKGGLADLEFLVQSLQLRYACEASRLIRTNTFDAVLALKDGRILRRSDAGLVEKNLGYLRRLEASIRMNSEATDFILPTERDRLQAVSAAMGVASAKALLRRIRSKQRDNHTIFTSVLKSRLR